MAEEDFFLIAEGFLLLCFCLFVEKKSDGPLHLFFKDAFESESDLLGF